VLRPLPLPDASPVVLSPNARRGLSALPERPDLQRRAGNDFDSAGVARPPVVVASIFREYTTRYLSDAANATPPPPPPTKNNHTKDPLAHNESSGNYGPDGQMAKSSIFKKGLSAHSAILCNRLVGSSADMSGEEDHPTDYGEGDALASPHEAPAEDVNASGGFDDEPPAPTGEEREVAGGGEGEAGAGGDGGGGELPAASLTVLRMRNLPYATTEEELKDKHIPEDFRETIIEVKIPRKADGRSLGYALLKFNTQEEADACKEKMDNMEIDGRVVTLGDASIDPKKRERKRRPERSGEGRGDRRGRGRDRDRGGRGDPYDRDRGGPDRGREYRRDRDYRRGYDRDSYGGGYRRESDYYDQRWGDRGYDRRGYGRDDRDHARDTRGYDRDHVRDSRGYGREYDRRPASPPHFRGGDFSRN